MGKLIGRAVPYRAAWLLISMLQPFAVRAANCEPEQVADVQLRVSPEGQLYMPATIGDRPVYFVLSLGSGLPMLLESAANSLGLTPKRINGTGRFSSNVTHFAKLEGLKVGNYRFLTRAAPIMQEPDAAGPRLLDDRLVAGTMGSSLFERVDVELNLAQRQMKLFKPFHCLERSPAYWNEPAAKFPMRFDEAGSLVFTLQLNGRKVEASMLSGGRESTLDANAAREFFGIEEDPGTDGSRTVFHPMSLTGPGLVIPESRVLLREGRCKLTGNKSPSGGIGYTTCLNTVPFKLGFDLLSQMRIYVASARRSVYVTFLPDAAASKDR
jgi:hypothetical protein